MSQPDQRTASQPLPELSGALSGDLRYSVLAYHSVLAVAGPKARQAISSGRYPDRPQPAPVVSNPNSPALTSPSPYVQQSAVIEAPVVTAPQEASAQTGLSQSEVLQPALKKDSSNTPPAIGPEEQIAPSIRNTDAPDAERLGAARTLVDEAYAHAA